MFEVWFKKGFKSCVRDPAFKVLFNSSRLKPKRFQVWFKEEFKPLCGG